MRDDTNFLGLFGKETATRILEPGQLLFAKGDPAHEMYIVKRGQLQILNDDFVLETVGPGDLIGEMALVDESPRSASVKALTSCEVIPVNESRVLWMVEQTPRFALRLLKVLSTRLRRTNELVKGQRQG